jgi:dCTP deaminase
MIINRHALLLAAPIKDMLTEKVRGEITSHGMSEAGYDIRIKQEVVFEGGQRVLVDGASSSGNFTLASTIEEFQMPTDMVGVVHDKSTWARKGLSVFNTVIEPGWKGFLTLELVYHGRDILKIPAGSGIAQVLFHNTAVTASYEGKYQNQDDQPVEAIDG